MATRYIVHGTDQQGQAVRKIIEAESAAEASQTATNIGVQVKGVEVDEGASYAGPRSSGGGMPAPGASFGAAPGPGLGSGLGSAPGTMPNPGPETVVWKGHPSQWVNAGWYTLVALTVIGGGVLAVFFGPWCLILCLLPLPWAAYRYLTQKTIRITLTSERLRIESGILAKKVEEIELYRVKDTELEKTVWQRMLRIGTVHMVTSDPTMPRITLSNIKDAGTVRESVRQQVERIRRLRGVRELDVADHMLP